MQESEKQFNPAHPENSDIRQAKEIGPERRLVEETTPAKTGVVNTPESIVEGEKGVKDGEGKVVPKSFFMKEGLRQPESVKSRRLSESVHEIMWEARQEFPEKMQLLLRKRIFEKKQFSPDEQSYFDKKRMDWWLANFGNKFTKKSQIGIVKARYTELKRERIETLALSLYAIDHGENIEKFGQDRRIIYYDDSRNVFYVFDNEKMRDITIGDILSDYAWGVVYMPDPEMPHGVFRALAKRILINETRRDIEDIYNNELTEIYGVPSSAGSRINKNVLEKIYLYTKHKDYVKGVIGEGVVREFLTRLSVNNPSLGFVVERSNIYEDTYLRYDFKLNRSVRLRGVALESPDLPREKYIEEKRRLGVQLTVGKVDAKKKKKVEIGKKNIKKPPQYIKKNVDDIVLLNVRFKGLVENFTRWLQEGRPSGGPEQYLGVEEKREILKKVAEDFIPLSDEEIELVIRGGERDKSSKEAA